MSIPIVQLTNNNFNENGYWTEPMEELLFGSCNFMLDLFDQNGYDLTWLEQEFAKFNLTSTESHRPHRTAIKQPWFTNTKASSNCILNHSLMFERKGYAGAALDQLKRWAKDTPRMYQLISLRPKWGLDFSMDWVDNEGNCFEILHWEYDSFSIREIKHIKKIMDIKLANIDWQSAGESILKRKKEWHHLDFFAQSAWKCDFFNVPREQFKMVDWQ